MICVLYEWLSVDRDTHLYSHPTRGIRQGTAGDAKDEVADIHYKVISENRKG